MAPYPVVLWAARGLEPLWPRRHLYGPGEGRGGAGGGASIDAAASAARAEGGCGAGPVGRGLRGTLRSYVFQWEAEAGTP